jgi:hypothetical protein
MQKLSQNIIDRLESKGLVLFGKERDMVMVCKPVTTKGNCIEGKLWKPINEFEAVEGELTLKANQFETNAPVLGIYVEENGFKVQVWQWVPGPGPGDFEVVVSTEEEVYIHTINYFFEKNEHFDAFKKYHLENSDSRN